MTTTHAQRIKTKGECTMRGQSGLAGLLLAISAAAFNACRVEPVAPVRATLQAPAAARAPGDGGAVNRPFGGSFVGTSEFVGLCEGGVLLRDRGTGVATHLGASIMEESGCYEMTPTSIASIGTGVGWLVAASGDTVRFTIESAGGDLTTGKAHATLVINGGSGRFQAARGEYQTATTLLPDQKWKSEIASGWISY
jgi:hypothetical protein